MSILRQACMVLGVSRRRQGPGCLTATGVAVALSVGVGSFVLPSAALAGTCIQRDVIHPTSAGGTGSTGPATCDTFSIAIGGGSGANAGSYGVAIGDASNATGGDSIALGRRANANASGSISLGSDSSATGLNATTLGRSAQAIGNGSTALGVGAEASANNTIALGGNALASGLRGNAIGLNVVASGQDSFAAGTRAAASGTDSIALGTDSTALGLRSVVIGFNSTASLQDSVAIGANNVAGQGATVVGHNSQATVGDAMALGTLAQATGFRATAIGRDAVASELDSFAAGSFSVASGEDAVALGPNANAAHENAVALGAGSVTAAAVATTGATINGTAYTFAGEAPTSTLSIGAVGSERTLTNLAAGRIAANSTDAVNGSQLFATNQAIDALGTDIGALGDGLTDLGDSVAVAFGGTSAYNPVTNTVTAGLAVGGSNYSNVQDALAAVNASATAGFFVQANGDVADNIGPGDTVQFLDGENIEITRTDGDFTVALASDLTVDSVTLSSGQVFDVSGLDMDGTGITGLTAGAIGAGSTEAVNGGQIHGIAQSVAGSLGGGAAVNPDGTISAPTYNIQGDNYNSVGGAFSAIDGNLTNLSSAIGDINDGAGITYFRANSTLPDSQATGVDSIAVGPDSIASGDNSFAAGNAALASGQDAVAIGFNAQASEAGALAFGLDANAAHENAVALGAGSVTAAAVATTGATINGTAYTFAGGAPTSTISIGAVGSERTLTNLAAGRIAADSTDAVNGSQLFATNEAVSALGAGFLDFGDSVAAGFGGGTFYDPATNTFLVGLEVGGTDYDNVQDALSAVGATAGAGFFVQANGDAATNIAPGGTVQFLDGDNIEITRTDGDFTVALASDIAVDSVSLSSGQVFDASGLDLNGTGITGLAAGTIGASSTDGVNGGQVFDIASSIAAGLGGGAGVNPDGTLSAPTYNIQGGSFSSVGDAFGAVDTSLTNLNTAIGDINSGGGITYFRANSTLADAQAVGADSVAVGPASVATGDSSVAMGNGASAGGETSVALGNASSAEGAASVALGDGATASEANSVALGAGSTTDAVVGTAGTTIRGQDYTFAGGTPVGTVSVGSAGAERTVTNVAAGRLSADSTDAVNGSQLHATNQAIETLEGGVGEFQQYGVQYDRNPDGTRANSLTLQGGDPNVPVLLANVARGTADNHVANVGQLNEGLQNNLTQSRSYTDTQVSWAVDTANSYTDRVAATTLDQANAYTDQRLSQLNADISGVQTEARRAAAIGLAAASLRFDDRPGKLSIAAGSGVWRSEGALAFGAGYTSENQRVRTNLTATNSGGDWGVGAGLSFTLN